MIICLLRNLPNFEAVRTIFAIYYFIKKLVLLSSDLYYQNTYIIFYKN